MSWKQIVSFLVAISIIAGGITWFYDQKANLQKNQYEQDILSMNAIFSDTKEVLQLRNILVHDVGSMVGTNGEYFPESNVYALKKINGFKYYQSKEDNLYGLFNNCNQKSLWADNFDFKLGVEAKTKEERIAEKINQYLRKRILSKTKPTINYWIYDGIDKKIKSCFIEFKVSSKTLKTAMKNTLDFFASPIFNTGHGEFLIKAKTQLDKYNSLEVFEDFKAYTYGYLKGASANRRKLILEKENLFFMDWFTPIAHIVLIVVLDKEDINFAILYNEHQDPVPNKAIENQITYWLSQYRIILNKDNSENGTD